MFGEDYLSEKEIIKLQTARERYKSHWDCPEAHLNFLFGAKIITFDELDTIRKRLQDRKLSEGDN